MRRGFLNRERDASDRRRVLISLTPAGERWLASLSDGVLDYLAKSRERRKGVGATRALAGIRTFTLASLTGATAGFLQQPLLTFAGALLVLTLAALDFWRRRARTPA